MIVTLLIASATANAAPPTSVAQDVARALSERQEAGLASGCGSADPADIVVCGGRPSTRYRIDPATLATIRAKEARPPKPELDATRQGNGGCVGTNSCGGGTIPLLAMAVTAMKVATRAIKGDDWREPLRTHKDDYQLYREAKDKSEAAAGSGKQP